MKNLKTDAQVLRQIYNAYLEEFIGPGYVASTGKKSPYLSIDVRRVATLLECDAEVLFGRLYLLGQKHRYEQSNGSILPLFYLKVGNKRHAIHFPYLVGVLADLEYEQRKNNWTIGLAIFAIVISVAPYLGRFLGK